MLASRPGFRTWARPTSARGRAPGDAASRGAGRLGGAPPDGRRGSYSVASPGGWRIIGRTPWRLFDPARAEPFRLLRRSGALRAIDRAALRGARGGGAVVIARIDLTATSARGGGRRAVMPLVSSANVGAASTPATTRRCDGRSSSRVGTASRSVPTRAGRPRRVRPARVGSLPRERNRSCSSRSEHSAAIAGEAASRSPTSSRTARFTTSRRATPRSPTRSLPPSGRATGDSRCSGSPGPSTSGPPALPACACRRGVRRPRLPRDRHARAARRAGGD